MDFLMTMTNEFYWYGVLLAAFTILAAIWVGNIVLSKPYETKSHPALLLLLFLSFLSWYAIAIVFIGIVIAISIIFIGWVFGSIFNDFFKNKRNIL